MGWSLSRMERENLWGLFIRHVLQHVLHPAVQDFAQGVQGGCGNRLSMLHAVECIGGHALLVDQVVFCDPFLKKSLIKRRITNQIDHQT